MIPNTPLVPIPYTLPYSVHIEIARVQYVQQE